MELQNETETSRRRRRQIDQVGWGRQPVEVTLRGIDIDVSWFNFDSIASQTCIAKVRLFSGSLASESEQIHNGQVTMVNIDSNGYKSMSTNIVSTDTGTNGYCMVIPCKSHRQATTARFRGFVAADYQNNGQTVVLYPSRNGLTPNLIDQFEVSIDNDKLYTDYDQSALHEAGTGPFYDWERKWRYSTSCSNAPFDHSHLQFVNEDCTSDTNTYNTPPLPNPNDANQPELNFHLWEGFYSFFDHFPRSFDPHFICHIRVHAPDNTYVSAASYIYDTDHPLYESGNDLRYGSRESCVRNDWVCLEARPAMDIAKRLGSTHLYEEQYTRLRVTTTSEHLFVTSINTELRDYLGDEILTEVNDYHFEVKKSLKLSIEKY